MISGDTRTDLAAVAPPYEALGAQVLHTAASGAVTVTVRQGAMTVDRFRMAR